MKVATTSWETKLSNRGTQPSAAAFPARGLPPKRIVSGRSHLAGIALFTLAGIGLHLVLRYLLHATKTAYLAPLYVVILAGGVPLIVGLVRRVAAREFGSDLLAGLSILTSVALGEYLVGSVVVLMLSGGKALEDYASRRASSVLDALAKRMPRTAHRKSGAEIMDVGLGEIRVGDFLAVYPHEICPADGMVVEGHGRMNEAFLTGEPFELSKTPGSKVLSGAINQESALTIQVEKLPVDSRYARIMRVMEETEQRRPRFRRLGDQLGAWYTPVAVLIALLAWTLTHQPHRFLAVLVIATPCPLLIAIPVAVIGAISLSARSGIIIKNPAILEQIDSCHTFIFDKTGTLTYGRPALTKVHCAPGFKEQDVLRAAASIERYSRHPLARAILSAAEVAHLQLDPALEIREPPGQGLQGTVDGKVIALTGRNRIKGAIQGLPPAGSGLECLVFIDGRFAAAFVFHDIPRKDSRVFVGHLKPRHRVSRTLLVSGDRDVAVRSVAEEVGITEIRAGATPEEKVAIVQAETARQKTLFVGDGINDAPAMQAATVGVALGIESDIAAEAADAVILESSIAKVDELIHIGRKMRSNALSSAIGGMALSIVGMIAASFGHLPPIEGAMAQELIDLAAILNAVRVAIPGGKLSDY